MIEIFINNNPVSPTVGIWIRNIDALTRRVTYAKPCDLEFAELSKDDAFTYVEPTFKFNIADGHEFLAALSQALIDAGYRDKKSDTSGEIKRLENHLNDMRMLVFKKEDINGD